MLSFLDPNGQSGRREFLRVGGLALGGLSLSQWLSTSSVLAAGNPIAKDRSVIFLFLHGGPSQSETFDPKMMAPSGIRSATDEVTTAIPGVTFGGTFPKLATLVQKLCVVRSFRTGDGNHDIKPIVGRESSGANLGSIYSRIAGSNHRVTGMPSNVALFPRAVDSSTQPETKAFGRFDATGQLGAAYAPFIPGEGEGSQQAMQLSMPRTRLDERRFLLSQLDSLRRLVDLRQPFEGADRFQQQAFETIVGGVARAFDLAQEDPGVVARYDTGPLVRPESIDRKWKNYNNYVDNSKSLGKLLLMARRLCEAGCGFVTVTTNFVWDMHSDINNAGVEEGMQYMGLPLDHALAAFIQDVESRGLSEKILLVVTGEMGRTPQINKNGGRDHWGGIAPLLIYGGGLKMGQVIGHSTPDGGEPASAACSIKDLIATIMHSLLDIGQVRVTQGLPNEVMQSVTSGTPIAGLVS